jgi:tetratricopeptide (TPR) repeat protein
MKNTLFYIFAAMLLFFSSCEDLNEELKTSFASENFFQNEAQLFAANVGIAKELTQDFWVEHRMRCMTYAPLKYGHVMTGQGGNPALSKYPATDASIELIWKAMYMTIGRANTVMKYAPESPVEEAVVNQYVAEAKFYRAWCYFNLVRLYGGVPLYTEPVESADFDILYKTRNTDEEIYAQIVEDLNYSVSNLPKTEWGYNPSAIRPRVAAAITLLGQVYLTMAGYPLQQTDNYNKAIATLKPLLDSEAEYGVGLVSNWISVFDQENDDNKELLFISGSDGNTMGSLTPFWTAPFQSGNNYSNNGTQRIMARNALLDLYTDGFDDDRYRNGFFWQYTGSNSKEYAYWYNNPDTDEGGYIYYDITGDSLALHTGTVGTIPNRKVQYHGNEKSGGGRSGIATKKFVSPESAGGWYNLNQKLWLRLPVAYLSLAEAYCEEGELDNAKTYLNILRARANASAITTTDQATLRQVIREEWTRELHMEFVSIYNIRRWYVGPDHYENNKWNVASTPAWEDYMYICPIPASQLAAHPDLEQNTGW